MNLNSTFQIIQYLPVGAVLIPFVGGIVAYIAGKKSEKLRNTLATITATLTLLTILSLFPKVIIEKQSVEASLPFLLGQIKLTVDPMSFIFALFTSFVWLTATIYSISYMQHEHKRNRYYAFLLFTLTANMGVVIAGDLISLFIFFELLGLLAYALIVHTETREAFKAGAKYLWMTILGGLSLLGGVFLFYGYTGSANLIPSLSLMHTSINIKLLIAVLMILGFGVKAGMMPVHVWLPDAHPIAPSPASALLSGVMIKAGAYGILRVIGTLFRPPFTLGEVASHASEAVGEATEHAQHLWETTSSLGYTIIWIGVVTMFLGVCLALLQENSKRMLAYHSISQMGYILMGLGCAGYLAHEGAMGFAGGVYHTVNHALFKACLFLGVGAVYYQTKELNMYKLGGLWKKMPLTALCTFIAACGISGIPLFNGYISKTLLHHAIVEAQHHHHLLSLRFAEIIFIVTGGGTLCSFMKLVIFTFLGKRPKKYDEVKEAPWFMLIPMMLLSGAIIALGLFPNLSLRFSLIPSLEHWKLPTELLSEAHFFTLPNLGDLLPSLVVGVVVFVVGVKYHLFHLHFPQWFGVDSWYTKLAQGSFRLARETLSAYNTSLAIISLALNKLVAFTQRTAFRVKRRYRQLVIAYMSGAPRVREQEITVAIQVELEEQRRAIVRKALKQASATLQKMRLSPGQKQERLNLIRKTIGEIAEIIIKKRHDIISQTMLELPAETVVESLKLASKEAAEEDLAEQVATRVATSLVRGKPKDMEVLRRTINQKADALTENFGLLLGKSIAEYRLIKDRVRAVEVSLSQRISEWIQHMARLLVEIATEERVPWMIETRYSHEEVARTRRVIREYARDMSFNILVIVAVIALFAFTIAYFTHSPR